MGHARSFKSAKKPRRGIRQSTAKRRGPYRYVAFLVPFGIRRARLRRTLVPQDNPIIDIIERLRESGTRCRIRESERQPSRVRIYFEDESGLMLLQLLNSSVVWKMFKLADEEIAK